MSAPVYSAWRPVNTTPVRISDCGNGQPSGTWFGHGMRAFAGGGAGASIRVASNGSAAVAHAARHSVEKIEIDDYFMGMVITWLTRLQGAN